MTAKKIIAVFGPDNNFLSYCTKKRALKLVKLNRAIKVNKQSIKLIQTKKDRTSYLEIPSLLLINLCSISLS